MRKSNILQSNERTQSEREMRVDPKIEPGYCNRKATSLVNFASIFANIDNITAAISSTRFSDKLSENSADKLFAVGEIMASSLSVFVSMFAIYALFCGSNNHKHDQGKNKEEVAQLDHLRFTVQCIIVSNILAIVGAGLILSKLSDTDSNEFIVGATFSALSKVCYPLFVTQKALPSNGAASLAESEVTTLVG